MTALRSSVLLLVAAIAGGATDPEVDELLQKTRDKVLESVGRLPRYACTETVAREQYRPAPDQTSVCTLGTNVRGGLISRDKLRLDVAIVGGREVFSWAGAPRFETSDIAEFIAGGASTSADFGTFLRGVFGGEPEVIRYQGERDRLALFEYFVPVARSSYTYLTDPARTAKKTGYRGTFSVDPSDGDLRRLVLETDEFEPADAACRVEHVIDYRRVTIGDGDFLLPEVSTMKALYRNGAEAVSEAHYSACREYIGESTIHFDNAAPATGFAPASATGPAPLPRGTRLQIALDKPIDTDAAAAGDEVTGVGTFGSGTGRVHGRILRLQQIAIPRPRWVMALRFDTIERGGVAQPISLRSIDGNRPSSLGNLPPDTGIFTLEGNGPIDFRSVWEIR